MLRTSATDAKVDYMKTRLNQSSIWIPTLLFIAAFFIRLWYGSTMLIAGDDMSSLAEAQSIGRNLQGLPFFLLLNLWSKVSLDPVWLHSLPALISALAVVICWYWLLPRGTYIALAASILLLVSACAIADSVSIRYYGLYLYASILFYSAYWKLLFKEPSARSSSDWLLLFLSGSLLIFSQLLGVLVVGLVMLHAAIYFKGSASRWLRILVAVGVVAGLVGAGAFILSASFRESAYLAFSRLIASGDQAYEGPRGWSPIMIAKIGIMFFSVAVGSDTYVLAWPVVVPALLLTLVFAFLGIVRLFRQHLNVYLAFAIIVGFLGILLVYGGLDALLPTSFHDSAAPRTVYFALPILFWIVAEGTEMIQRVRARWLVLAAIVALQLVGLVNLFQKDYPVLLGNNQWADIFAQINLAASQKPSSIWADGEAHDDTPFYFEKTIPVQNAYTLLDDNYNLKPEALDTALKSQRFIFVGFDAREGNRCRFDGLLSALSTSNEVLARVDYPMFIYAYDPGPNAPDMNIALPRTVFPMELQDLKLPQSFKWNDQSLTVDGVYTLPNCQKTNQVDVSIAQNIATSNAHSILLLTNLTQADKISDGATVAELSITVDGNEAQTIPLRKGHETQSWNGSCADSCRSALSWHKRIALVGNSAFPDAYKDFQAQIWGVEIPITQKPIQSLQLKLLDDKAHLNIYGLYLLP